VNPVRVKICGLTEPAQARWAADCGAEAVGLVFAPSKRRIDAERAAAIVRALPAEVWKVGVFVDARAAEINVLARRTGITHAQLHGAEEPGLVADLDVPAIKAFGVRSGQFILDMHDWLVCLPAGCEDRLAGVLLDAVAPDAAGGTGRRFNWDLVARARAEGAMDYLPDVFLAGGLDPSNAVEACRTVQPDWLDVSSGVEISPGVKDPQRVRAFIEAAKTTQP
jgi:phosphoribosylanthranilate isomerase